MSTPCLRAIIFDFNGVIADDEVTHFMAFQQALAEEKLCLTKEEYYRTYLGMDERTCAASLIKMACGKDDPARAYRIAERKADIFHANTEISQPPLFPGVVELVEQAAQRYRIAIASGGRREQIEYALRKTPIESAFAVLVSAEDALLGKPDPSIYNLALKRINAVEPQPVPAIRPEECVVIEDSVAGILAGRGAGMKVVGVATTYPADQLINAHLVLPNLTGGGLQQIEALFR